MATAYRICPLCEATCGLAITLDGDRVKVIRGDRDNPFSRGYVCPKGTTLGRLHADPDRLRRPLVRRDGRHVEVSWREAFAEVERLLAPILAGDRDGCAIYVGNPNAHHLDNAVGVRPLIKALGTRNVFTASTVDQMPRHVACGLMYGAPLTIPVPDLDRTDHLLILGANPYESNGSLATAPDWPGRLEAIRDRGGRVVVVDPRRTKTAANADRWVPIRPGTDALLLTAMLSVLFSEGLVEPSPHVDGVDELAAAVERFIPERVAASCRIEPETIRRLARELAAAPSAAVYGRIGTHTTPFGTVAAWAVDALCALTGNLDRPGGIMFPFPPHLPAHRPARPFRRGRWRSRVRDLPEVMGELPVATLPDEIETPGEGQVRALITVAGNPALTAPDAGRVDRALAGLDAMISVDPYLNETTRHADVVLPPPSALQRSHYDLVFTGLSVRDFVAYSPPVLPRDDGQPSELEILATLAGIASGMGSDVDPEALLDAALTAEVGRAVSDPSSPVHGRDPDELAATLEAWPYPERFLDLMLRTGHRGDAFGDRPGGLTLSEVASHPHGLDLGPLQPRLPDLLATPSGRVELAPEPVIADLERLEGSLTGDDAGMVLVSRRHLRSNNSWLHNVDVLVRGAERCTLWVHPDDADRLGLADGATARVASRVGEVAAPVEVTDEVMAGVVSLPYGWGHGAEGSRLSVASTRPGVNTNLLTDATPLDPLSGNAVLNGIPVEVRPAGRD